MPSLSYGRLPEVAKRTVPVIQKAYQQVELNFMQAVRNESRLKALAERAELNHSRDQFEFKKFINQFSHTHGWEAVPTGIQQTYMEKIFENENPPKLVGSLLKNYREWASKLDTNEVRNIRHYTNIGYRLLNRYLEGDVKLQEEKRKVVESYGQQLHESISKGRLPENIEVFHRTNRVIFRNSDFVSIKELEGKALQIKKFFSTSYFYNSCARFPGNNVRMNIQVPFSATGSYLGNLSSYRAENEILFDWNQRIKIKRAVLFDNNLNLDCEMQPKDDR